MYGLFEKCDQSILDGSAWLCRRYPKLDADCRELQLPRPSPFPPVLAGAEVATDAVLGVPATPEEDMPQDELWLWRLMSPAAQSGVSIFAQRKYRYSAFCSYWRLAGSGSSWTANSEAERAAQLLLPAVHRIWRRFHPVTAGHHGRRAEAAEVGLAIGCRCVLSFAGGQAG